MARVKELPKKGKLLITSKKGTLEISWEEACEILAELQVMFHEANLGRREF